MKASVGHLNPKYSLRICNMNHRKLLLLVANKISKNIKNRIRTNQIEPKTQKNGGTTLVESSRLLNSIYYQIQGDTIIIGTNIKYAAIHQFGGIITPSKAKFLAIPLTKRAKVISPRDFSDTFVAKGVIFRKDDNGKITPLYALKKQVKIPARPFLFLDDNDKKDISDIISNYMQSYIAKK